MLQPRKSSNLTLASFGVFNLIFGAWDIGTGEQVGYIFIGLGIFFIISALVRHLKDRERERRTDKVLQSDESAR